MSHWSEGARASANGSMGAVAVDGAVRDCDDRDWAPLAKTEELPHWRLEAKVLPDDQPAGSASGRGSGR